MLKRMFCLAALTLLALFTWWVLWTMVMGALTPEDELRLTLGPALESGAQTRAFWCFVPSWPTLRSLVRLLLDTPEVFSMFWNGCLLAFPQVAGQLAVAAPAAWAFSKLRFPFRRGLFAVYLVLMVLPFQITMVPNHLVLDKLGLIDTPFAVILPGVFSAFPVFIIKKGFDAVPQSLLEAAALDGAGPLRCFFSVGLPLGLPAILSAATLGFIEAWNAIEQPMMFLQDRSNWPLSLYLSNITVEDLGLAMAASLMMLAPPLLLFMVGRKYLEGGIGLSAQTNDGM